MEKSRISNEEKHFNKLAVEYERLFGLDKPVALFKVNQLVREFALFLKDIARLPKASCTSALKDLSISLPTFGFFSVSLQYWM